LVPIDDSGIDAGDESATGEYREREVTFELD
jgi:hypothetical protein